MVFWGVVIAIALAVALLLPFLIKEMKAQSRRKPGTPAGTGDTTPGQVEDPAPGQFDGQADPWSPKAHRP